MTDGNVTLSREQVGKIFKALDGIGNLVKNLVSTPGIPRTLTRPCRTSR
jgi:hypothetical protein